MQLIVSPLSRLVFVLSGQELKLIYDVAILTSMTGIALHTFYHHLGVVHLVLWFSIANALAYVLYYLVLSWIVLRATSNVSASGLR